jgi:proteic killer suppression protein
MAAPAITQCVIVPHDPRLRRSGDGARLERPAQPPIAGADTQSVALRKLRLLNQARVLADLPVPPGNRLEALKGDRAGQYSIRINDQWRICFRWNDRGAQDVQILDYHG